MGYKKILGLLAVLAVASIAVVIALLDSGADLETMATAETQMQEPDPYSARSTANGEVIGFADSNNSYGWLGIPYAAPPVGPLRWRAPQPATNWTTPLSAVESSMPCTQHWTFLAGTPGKEGDIVGSEDCLYLNIWAPRRLSLNPSMAQRKLPVMLWIHGGGNTVGSARFYTGEKITAQQQVIFVSLNYRLGPLGWFNHSALRNTAANLEDASGNYGLLDIIAGLQWVQTNIDAFGGDPNNVTVFGESAGARNIYGLLASPLAKGLFHKAISQSGSSRTESMESAELFADQLFTEPYSGDSQQRGWPNSSNEILAQLLVNQNIANSSQEAKNDLSSMTDKSIAAVLYQQSPESLINVSMSLVEEQTMPLSPQLLRDGHVLPAEPLAELFAVAGNYNAVPMIMGANRDEDRSAMANDKEFVSLRFGVLPSIKDHERYQRYSNYYADRWHSTGVSQMARLMTGANPEVGIYGYRFDWDETPNNWPVDLPELLGAGHGLEVSFVFNDFVGGLRLPFLYGEDSEPGREKLSRAIMNYWGRFAHSGTPGTGLLQQQPEWTAWQETGANIMVLDSPADGGWRMEHYYPSPEATMQRIESDTAISSQQERCKLFVESFLLSYHSSDYWDPERYLSLSGGGCAEYDPYKFEGIF